MLNVFISKIYYFLYLFQANDKNGWEKIWNFIQFDEEIHIEQLIYNLFSIGNIENNNKICIKNIITITLGIEALIINN